MKYMNTLPALLFAVAAFPGLVHAEPDSGSNDATDVSASESGDARLRELMVRAQRLRGEGRLYDAVEAFITVLEIEPNLHRARLELALTQYALMNFEEARLHAQRLLDDPALAPGITQSIRKLVRAIDEQEQALSQRHTWQPRIGYGLIYDNNVNVGSSSDLIEIGDYTYRLNANYLPRSDIAQSLTLGLTHRYQMGNHIRIGQQAARQYWQSELTLYHKDYREEDDFNLGVVSVSTGPAWIVPKAWRAHLRLRADHIQYGDENYALYGSLNPGVTWLRENGEFSWNASLARRDYLQDGYEDRNSTYLSSDVSYGHYFLDGAVSLRGGLKLFQENARNDYYSNDGHQIFAGVSYQPRSGVSLYAKLVRKETEYEGVSSLFGTNRDETQVRSSIGVVYRIPEGVLDGVRLRADYTHTERDSSISLYSYDRNQAMLSMEFAF